MIYHLTTIFSLCFYILMGPCACKPKTNVILDIDNETKEFTLFKPTTYWVYLQQPSGKTDTQTIIRNDFAPTQISNCFPILNTYFLEGVSSLSKDTIKHELTVDDFTGRSWSIFSYRTDSIINRSQLLYFSGNINDSIIEFRGNMATLRLINILNSYQIGSTNFSSVKIFERIPSRFYPADTLTKIYWAKNIGIIKKEYASGSFEELIKYDVKQ